MHIVSKDISLSYAENFTQHAKRWPFHSYRPIQIPLQTVQVQMRRLVTSRLIRIYTVCHSVIDFWLKPLFATMDVYKLSDVMGERGGVKW